MKRKVSKKVSFEDWSTKLRVCTIFYRSVFHKDCIRLSGEMRATITRRQQTQTHFFICSTELVLLQAVGN